MRASSVQNDTLWFLKGGGEIGLRIQHYWKETQLQDPVGWSDTLKSALSLMLNSKMPSVLFWGPKHICFYNDACIPVVGNGDESQWVLGKTGAEVWPARWAVVKPVVDSVLSEGRSIWHNDGPFPVYSNKSFEDAFPTFCYTPVYGKEGTASGVLVTCSEVAEGRRSSNLGNYEPQFQNFVRQIPVGIMVLMGKEMRVETVNEIYGRVVGKTPEELLNRKLFDVIPEAENDLRVILDTVRLSQKPFYLYGQPYFAFEKGEKREGFLNFVYQPYRESGDGAIGGVMVLCHDVTKQVKKQKRAESAGAKANLALGTAGLGTFEVNLLTDEIKSSERFNAIWGVRDGVSNGHLTSLIHPEDRAIAVSAYKDSIDAGHLHYEVRIVCEDRAQRWVRMTGTVEYDADLNANVLIGVAQDITEQKNFANDLRRFVDERTRELQTVNEELAATNEELSETNVHLTRANKDLEQFAYVASHDLQEPLRKIQTFVNIIDERFADELSEAVAGYLGKVAASARRMSNLIKDLLDYSRLTFNGSLFQPVDLTSIVNDVISDFEVLITQKKTVIHVGELPVIEAIPVQMNQLFYNLMGNAVKFSRKDVRPEITITCRPLDSSRVSQYRNLRIDKSYYEIIFADNGIGFSQQYAEQIFTIFQRLNDKAIYGGYGMGLALCRKIVDNHDGAIRAVGRENEGASFTVILPKYHT